MKIAAAPDQNIFIFKSHLCFVYLSVVILSPKNS